MALRLLANDSIRKEAGVSFMRTQIKVVSSHMEPNSAAEVVQLFGTDIMTESTYVGFMDHTNCFKLFAES